MALGPSRYHIVGKKFKKSPDCILGWMNGYLKTYPGQSVQGIREP